MTFPTGLLSAGVLFSLFMFVLVTGHLWSVHRASVKVLGEALRVQQLGGTIVHLDEVLTMSARMAAATGDLRWEARYREYEPKLDVAIGEAHQRARGASDADMVTRTDAANRALVAMENDAFEDIRQGRPDHASSVLSSQAYEAQKQVYAEGIHALIVAMQGRVAKQFQTEGRRTSVAGWVAAAVLAMLVVAWAAALWLIQHHTREHEDARRALLEAHDLLEQRVEQRTRALEAAKSTAEAGTRAKGEFLANMSHEIRTPMTAILGFADSLVDESLPLLERREAVETIRRSGEHLLQVINDVLDLSKIEAGKLIVELVGCPTCSVLAEVQSFMAPKAASKQLALSVEFLTPIPERIRTDPVRLRQILLNLVGNSLKFTESGGVRVVIRHVPDPVSALQFDIVDTGIGMTPEQAGSIFSAFDQADASTTRRFGGTGLGLTISKRLANLLGGDVVLVETGPGLGTRFRATIPTGPLGGVTMLTDPRDAVGVQTHLPEPPRATCRPLRGRILLAEDGADNQRLFTLILRKAGADVTIVENGKLAVDRIVAAAAAGEPFGLVLMDMQMPVLDGYAATRALREAGCSLPIIALTAHAMEGEREKCLAAGCDEYVTKPIQRAKLIQLIRRHLDATASSARLVSCKAPAA